MSEAIAFDTHRFVKNLTANGFTEAQAEALAYEQIHLLEANLATKSDLAAVKSDLEAKIAEVKSDLEVKIAEVKSDLAVVKSELEVKIETVRSDLEVKIAEVKAGVETARAELQRDIEKARTDLSRWMLAGWVTQTGVIAALSWYFFSGPPGG